MDGWINVLFPSLLSFPLADFGEDLASIVQRAKEAMREFKEKMGGIRDGAAAEVGPKIRQREMNTKDTSSDRWRDQSKKTCHGTRADPRL